MLGTQPFPMCPGQTKAMRLIPIGVSSLQKSHPDCYLWMDSMTSCKFLKMLSRNRFK